MGSVPSFVVQARALVKDYGTFHALGPVDIDVPQGAIGLLGPNGAGKTTFIKTLLGLLPATGGQGTVLGLRIGSQSMDIRQRVGYMPELDAQIINLSGFQYVAYAGELAGLPRRAAIQRAHEVLNFVGLGEERYRPIETYSTGMRQRAKLAQAIVHDPRLLFLDEPTNGLDPKGRDEMLDLIRDLVYKRDITVILSSHLLPDVESVCKYVIVLNQGKVAAAGPIEDLKKRNLSRYEVRVKGDPAALVAWLRGHGAQVDLGDSGLVETTFPAGRDVRFLLQGAQEVGAQLRHFSPTRNTLEDVFLGTVGAT